MRILKNMIFAVICLAFTTANYAYAEPNEVMALKGQIEALNKKLAAIEGKLNSVEGQVSGIKPSIDHPGHYGSASTPEGGLLKAMQDVQVGGYLDVQYNTNLSSSGTVAGGNPGRIFDNDRKSFTVNAAELNFTKEADPEGGAGFRIDIAMGEDADVVNADGSSDTSKIDLQQAYIEYVAPLSFFEGSDVLPETINIKAGRFATLAGLEVIEGPDNWNISRSFAFGMTIPFIHTGVRTNFQLFGDKLDVYAGINNGWDNPVDNNTYKTLEFGLGYSPLENVSLFHALYYGPETTATNGHRRFLLTNVVTWDATEKLSFMGEFNAGTQRRELTQSLDNVQWYSFNGYARYQLDDNWAVAYRGEIFHDENSFRSSLDQTLWEQTLTLERKLTDNMLARLEYRYDKADNLNALNGESHQSTIGAQVLYTI